MYWKNRERCNVGGLFRSQHQPQSHTRKHSRRVDAEPANNDDIITDARTFVSPRTGGFEVPSAEMYGYANDDTTLPDASIYTDLQASSLNKADSTASTVWQSGRSTPLYTDDIQERINSYHGAIANLQNKFNKQVFTTAAIKGKSRSTDSRPIDVDRVQPINTSSTEYMPTSLDTSPSKERLKAARKRLESYENNINNNQIDYKILDSADSSVCSTQSPSVLFQSTPPISKDTRVPKLPLRSSRSVSPQKEVRKPFQHKWELEQKHQQIPKNSANADSALGRRQSRGRRNQKSEITSSSLPVYNSPKLSPKFKQPNKLLSPKNSSTKIFNSNETMSTQLTLRSSSTTATSTPPSPTRFDNDYKTLYSPKTLSSSFLENAPALPIVPFKKFTNNTLPEQDCDMSISSHNDRLGVRPLRLESNNTKHTTMSSPLKGKNDETRNIKPSSTVASPSNTTTAVSTASRSTQPLVRTKEPLRSLNKQMKQHSVSSIISFSIDDDGAGFEVDEEPIAKPIVNLPSALTRTRRCDSEASSTSFDWNEASCHNKCNPSHETDTYTSAGAVRLTAAGLQQHERKTSLQKSTVVYTDQHAIQAWLQDRDSRRWHRERHEEKEQELIEKNSRVRHRSETRDTSSHISSTSSTHKKGLNLLFRKEDVADMSLAPLNAMEHLSIHPVTSEELVDSSKKGGFLRFLRKKSETVDTAKAILEKERARAREAEVKRRLREAQERERIEAKRRAYLEHIRLMEADKTIPPIQSIEKVEKKTNGYQNMTVSTTDISTLSSCTSMPLCVVCHLAQRTHIATPCMHFSFCRTCVQKILSKNATPTCSICFESVVAFNAVSL